MNAHTQADYREQMQAAALAFLQRHKAEHLSGEKQALFNRCSLYLVNALEVPRHLADTLTGLAMGELESSECQHHINIDESTAYVCMVTHPATGMTYPVPVAAIVKALINKRAPLSAVQ